MMHDRSIEQHRVFIGGVVPSARRMDIRLLFVDDLSRTDDISYFRVGVIEQSVAGQNELRIGQHHLFAEHRLTGVRTVVTTHRNQGIERVLYRTTVEIIRHSGEAVIIQTVGRQDGRVLILAAMH